MLLFYRQNGKSSEAIMLTSAWAVHVPPSSCCHQKSTKKREQSNAMREEFKRMCMKFRYDTNETFDLLQIQSDRVHQSIFISSSDDINMTLGPTASYLLVAISGLKYIDDCQIEERNSRKNPSEQLLSQRTAEPSSDHPLLWIALSGPLKCWLPFSPWRPLEIDTEHGQLPLETARKTQIGWQWKNTGLH
jgi:hypothetical protein